MTPPPIIPITIVHREQNGRTRLIHSRKRDDGRALGQLLPSDEGITWIRGHHSATSPAGRALLTAYALVGIRRNEWIDVTFVQLDTNGARAELIHTRLLESMLRTSDATEEGTRWIRGRHNAESAEGSALLEAFARVRDQYEGRFGMRR